MAKLFSLKELIDQESGAEVKTCRPIAVSPALTSAAKIITVRRSYDDATIWKMALQLEMPALSRSFEACNLQND